MSHKDYLAATECLLFEDVDISFLLRALLDYDGEKVEIVNVQLQSPEVRVSEETIT